MRLNNKTNKIGLSQILMSLQGWGWLTDFLVRVKIFGNGVNWLTDDGVCFQICLIFMNGSIF